MPTNLNHWRTPECERCTELVTCRTASSKIVVATPCRKGGILAIGEAPGSEEDVRGIGFSGDAGKTLRALLAGSKLTSSDFGVANICRCRPPENRKPKANEVSACLPYLAHLIANYKPTVILAVGGRTAVKVFCGRQGTLSSIIKNKDDSQNWLSEPKLAHEGIRSALKTVTYVVPMPHTSPMLNGKKATEPLSGLWSDIAEKQVKTAARLYRDSKISPRNQ